MPAIIKVSLSATIMLEHGNQIGRLTSVGYLPIVLDDPRQDYDNVHALKESIDEQIAEWLAKARELEENHKQLQAHMPTVKRLRAPGTFATLPKLPPRLVLGGNSPIKRLIIK